MPPREDNPRRPEEPDLFPLENLGEFGLVKDVEPFELPPSAWSHAENVRFTEYGVESFLGEVSQATPAVAPYGLFPVTRGNVHVWAYLGLAGGRAYDGATHYDISPAIAFTGAAANLWSGTTLNGNLVVTNGVDEPHYWPMDTGVALAKLPGWPAGALCQDIISYKQFLLALNVQLSGTDYAYRVKWSHQAAGGGLPSSWDATDPTLDAGERDLGDEAARLVGAYELKDVVHLFTEKRSQGIQFIGGTDVFRFFNLSGNAGLVAKNAVSTFEGPTGPSLAWLSDGDLVMSDGQRVTSLVHRRARRWLFDNLDQDNYPAAVLVNNRPRKELWLGFPISGSTDLSHALVLDYGSPGFPITVRELPAGTRYLSRGFDLSGSPLRWSDLTADTWGSIGSQTWGDRNFDAVQDSILIAAPGDIFKGDSGNLFEGVAKTAVAERTALNISEGNKVVTVTGVRVSARGGPFQVTVGAQDSPKGPVRWGTPRTFTPGDDYRVDARSCGRLITVRLSSADNTYWRVDSLAFEYWPQGDR